MTRAQLFADFVRGRQSPVPLTQQVVSAAPQETLTLEQIRWLNEADAYDARIKCEEIEVARADHERARYENEGNDRMEMLMRELGAAKRALIVSLTNNARQARYFARAK
jgi:hypothetical protein